MFPPYTPYTHPTVYTSHQIHAPCYTHPTMYMSHVIYIPPCTHPTTYRAHCTPIPSCTQSLVYISHVIHIPVVHVLLCYDSQTKQLPHQKCLSPKHTSSASRPCLTISLLYLFSQTITSQAAGIQTNCQHSDPEIFRSILWIS